MHITLPSGTAAEVATPTDGGAPTRGLVIIPDIGGPRPLFEEMAQRLADDNGWAVCSYDLWAGQPDVSAIADRMAKGGLLEDERVLGDAAAAADATGCAEVAVMGFCMGGMYALKAAGTGRFVRAVSFYGMAHIRPEWQSPTQGDPLAAVTAPGACPALELVGTADAWVPAEDIDALRAAGVEVVTYEGADHGFVHDPSRPNHRPDDAADAWRRAVAHLAA